MKKLLPYLMAIGMASATALAISQDKQSKEMPDFGKPTNAAVLLTYDQDKDGDIDTLETYLLCPPGVAFMKHPYFVIDNVKKQAYYDHNIDGVIDGQSGINGRILKYLKIPDCKEYMEKMKEQLKEEQESEPESDESEGPDKLEAKR